MILYPAIDLINGKCVRLSQGDFARVTHYETNPLEVARGYQSAGSTCIHIVDLDGARAGMPKQAELIGGIAKATGLKVQSGGGIRTVRDAETVLDAGVSRLVIGSLAVKQPAVTREIYRACGPDRFTLAVDVNLDGSGTPMVATEGWRESGVMSLWAMLETYAALGLKRLLCTDIGRDGMMTGPNLTLYKEVHARYPELELQASGGVSSLEDLRQLKAAGIPGVIIGKALFEGKFTLSEAIQC